MKLKLATVAFFILATAGFIFFRSFFQPVIANNLRPSFKEWYSQSGADYSSSKSATEKTIEIFSPVMRIDTIYRSMQGPSCSVEINLSPSWFQKIKNKIDPELI